MRCRLLLQFLYLLQAKLDNNPKINKPVRIGKASHHKVVDVDELVVVGLAVVVVEQHATE